MTTLQTKSLSPSPLPVRKSGGGWSLRARLLASGILAFHVLAIVIGPLTFASSTGPGMASPPLAAVMNVMRPYVDAAFLNHGYFFFAPNPGSSHLVRYRVEGREGDVPLTQTMPDKQRHWPRLLYHRHFMLSESLNSFYAPPQPPAEVAADPEQLANWRRSREVYLTLRESFQAHLSQRYRGRCVELVRVEHRPPDPIEVLGQGRGMRDPRLYRDLPEQPVQERDPVSRLPQQRLPEQRLPEQRLPEQRLPRQRLPRQELPQGRSEHSPEVEDLPR